MASDIPRLRYILPKFRHGYTAMMKTLASSLKYAASDPTQFRLHVLEYGRQYGVKATLEAFHIGRRTYFDWQYALVSSHGRLAALVPKSTRPHLTRRMQMDERLLTFIRSVRETYGRVGKQKLKVLVAAYAQSLGIPGYGATKIGKIIKRHHYFFDPPHRQRTSRFIRLRTRRSPRGVKPGYVEMDSITLYVNSHKLLFITLVDVVTKVAFAQRVTSLSAKQALKVLQEFQAIYHLAIHTVQTDNGSEFLAGFHAYLVQQGITHMFSYPHTPKVNGIVERFNRTLQEEFIDRCDAWWYNPSLGDQKLVKFLAWYNQTRPHTSLNYQTPLTCAQQYI